MKTLASCMYCGSTETLTDEHVIPYAMGGTLVFPASSCKKCAAATSRDELRVLRGFMYEGRLVAGLPSRRKKKQPVNIKRILLRPDGTELTRDLLLQNGVAVIHLPIFQMPGILYGGGLNNGIQIKEIGTLHLGMKNMEELYSKEGLDGTRIHTKIDVISFCKVLCKIAYSYHIQQKGIFPKEESPALGIILNKQTDFDRWIGSCDTDSQASSSWLHELKTDKIIRKDGWIFHVVYIGLFSGMGANSSYTVITRVNHASKNNSL